MKIVFDTTVLVDCLRGDKRAVNAVEKVIRREIEGLISVITEAELHAGKECNTEKGLSKVNNIVSLFTQVLVTSEVAKQAGLFRRRYGIGLPDAIIAATALLNNATVWTKNVSDFEVVRETRTEAPY